MDRKKNIKNKDKTKDKTKKDNKQYQESNYKCQTQKNILVKF